MMKIRPGIKKTKKVEGKGAKDQKKDKKSKGHDVDKQKDTKAAARDDTENPDQIKKKDLKDTTQDDEKKKKELRKTSRSAEGMVNFMTKYISELSKTKTGKYISHQFKCLKDNWRTFWTRRKKTD